MSHARRRSALFTGVFAVVATAGVLVSAPAQASAPAAVSTTGNYCAYNGATGKMSCVQSEKDYTAARAAALGSVSPQSSFLLGRFFDDTGYSTAHGYIDYFGSGQCDSSLATPNFGWPDTTTWENRISSFQGYSNCYIKAYELTGYSTGGAVLAYANSRSSVGVLNDHIWSAQFS